MGESFLEELRRYLEFGPGDEAALRELAPLARDKLHEISEAFYDKLTQHDSARAVFRSEGQVERLKATLVDWMERLLDGPWDEEYYQRRSRIGRVHVKIALPQRYMMTGMGLIHQRLMRVANDSIDDRERLKVVHDALAKIVQIELAIMLETYREEYMSAIARYEQTQREDLQQQLDLSEALYHATVESAAVIVCVCNGDGEITLCNLQAEEVTGRSRAELIGQSLADVFCEQRDRDRVRTGMQATLDNGAHVQLGARLLRKTGEERWLRWHFSRIEREDGQSVCAVALDVTEEHELTERNRRTENLASLGAMAAGLAHEIRNPLNAAQLQLTIVERRLKRSSEVDTAALRSSELVRQELARLGRLVAEVLEFSRPRPLRLDVVDVHEVVSSSLDLLRPVAQGADVDLQSNCPQPLRVRVDTERLQQVILNLVQNAIDASGGGTVGIECSRQGNRCVLQISDDGPGVPDEVRLFEPFSTTKEGGTGLGLAIVHRIVDDHDGSIFHERRGDRTFFVVELPIDGPP